MTTWLRCAVNSNWRAAAVDVVSGFSQSTCNPRAAAACGDLGAQRCGGVASCRRSRALGLRGQQRLVGGVGADSGDHLTGELETGRSDVGDGDDPHVFHLQVCGQVTLARDVAETDDRALQHKTSFTPRRRNAANNCRRLERSSTCLNLVKSDELLTNVRCGAVGSGDDLEAAAEVAHQLVVDAGLVEQRQHGAAAGVLAELARARDQLQKLLQRRAGLAALRQRAAERVDRASRFCFVLAPAPRAPCPRRRSRAPPARAPPPGAAPRRDRPAGRADRRAEAAAPSRRRDSSAADRWRRPAPAPTPAPSPTGRARRGTAAPSAPAARPRTR